MSQPQELKTNESVTGPRYAEFTGKPMSDVELLALMQKGYSIRQGPNKQGQLMVWLQLPLERRVAVDPAQLQRFKRLGWVQPVQSTTGTIWELNRQPQPPANSKVTPIGSKRLPRTKITQVVDDEDEDESGDDRHDHPTPTPTATANPNPCVRLFGPGPEGQTCKGCIHLLATRANRVYYKCRQRKITSSASTDHHKGWDACKKYQKLETTSDPANADQPARDQGHSAALPPTNTNTNLGA